MSNPQIFISYSKSDADWVRSFAEALKQRGVRVWLDQFRIAAGESVRDALEDGLRGSDVFVALIDPASPPKPNLFFELGAAIGMGKRVIPILPREMDISKLPLEFRVRRYLLRDSPEDTAEELTHALVAA
ncbi:MAG TPA: toll/interleukin-1 receptor domain-containing protein [Terriglobia bacterium]|nr:toll/interleukin-1 receptor domain-containing protein [Terriglobia bacterium]